LTSERVERRLAAVLAADVAGYSRLMGANEEGTLARLKAVRKALFDPAIASHRGRIVKTTGDGVLVEFASAVDAVRGAVEAQRAMAEQNARLPQDQRIEFRIGIHVGDIIFDENDIFGDGVNVAARVENECEPGGVYLSDDAFRQVRGKTSFVLEDIGEHALKNIEPAVRLYAVRNSADARPEPPVGSGKSSSLPPALPLPNKPSIVVLPFQNMSGDQEQEYFADGLTENLTTDLSRFPGIFVIGRNTAFTFKGKTIDLKLVGRELGVRYVLEGSVQRGGDRIRVSVQLIDAQSGGHLWAERFDRERGDLFQVQDEISRRVAFSLTRQLSKAELERGQRERSSNPDSARGSIGIRGHAPG
jgi:TolB-like protein/class 3 adenylate cyclase